MIAVLIPQGEQVIAEVFEDPDTKIVCRLDDRGAWEPLYGLCVGVRCSLPHCFELNRASLDALDAALRKG